MSRQEEEQTELNVMYYNLNRKFFFEPPNIEYYFEVNLIICSIFEHFRGRLILSQKLGHSLRSRFTNDFGTFRLSKIAIIWYLETQERTNYTA